MDDARPLADFLLTQRPRGLAGNRLGNAAARRWHPGGEPGCPADHRRWHDTGLSRGFYPTTAKKSE